LRHIYFVNSKSISPT